MEQDLEPLALAQGVHLSLAYSAQLCPNLG
jgi:hypothetical protein